jgi:hypothetical protein
MPDICQCCPTPPPACLTPASPPPPQVLLKVVEPYTRVTIPFIAGKLNITPAEVESLVVSLILDSRITGHIDQVGARQQQATQSRPAAC